MSKNLMKRIVVAGERAGSHDFHGKKGVLNSAGVDVMGMKLL